MIPKNKLSVTVQRNYKDKTVVCTLVCKDDANIDELGEMIQDMLIGIGYTEQTINKILNV